MRTAIFWVVTQPVVVIAYRRFRTTYGSICRVLEMSVRNYHYSLRAQPRRAQLSSDSWRKPEITGEGCVGINFKLHFEELQAAKC